MKKNLLRLITLFFMLVIVLLFVKPYTVQAAAKVNMPTGLTISTVNGNPKISWKKVSGVDGYRLYRMTEDDDDWVKVATITKTTYTDKKWIADEGTVIKYRVKAFIKTNKKTNWSKPCSSKKWRVPESVAKDSIKDDKLQNDTIKMDVSEDTDATLGEKNALAKAKSYLKVLSFSYEGLINQLEYEKFTYEESKYGADKCGADWFEQALKKAKSYLNVNSFSYERLIEQLEYEKFTAEECKYGADNCGADWFEQAAKKAKSYLKILPFSYEGLINQLEYEGFTYEQAVYGAESVGY